MTSISVYESNIQWMNSVVASEAQQLAAEKRKMEEAGSLFDAEWAKPEPDLSSPAERAAEDAEALALEAADKAVGKKAIVTEESRSGIPFSTIENGLEELQKGGKTIGQVGTELEIGNFLLKRVRFLAEYFFQQEKNETENDIRAIVNVKAHQKLRCGNLGKINSLIKCAEPFKEAYNSLYRHFNRSSLYDIERPQDQIQTYIPIYSSFPPTPNTVQSAPLFKGVAEKEWEPYASDYEDFLPSQTFPSSAFLHSTPTFWDWPNPSEQSNEGASVSVAVTSKKRKTPAVPDAIPVAEKKEKVVASEKKRTFYKFSQVTKAIREYQKGEKDVHMIARENGLSSKTLKGYIKVLEKFFTDNVHIDDIDDVIDELGYYKLGIQNMPHLVKIALPAKELYLNHPLVEPKKTDPLTASST